MKRFHFDLEKVLELRTYHEKQAELYLARSMAKAGEIQDHLKLVASQKSEALRDRFAPGVTPEIMWNYERYILRLDTKRDELLKEAAKAELVLAEAREAFLEARRDRKVLDKLKDKRYREFKKESALEEVRELDELPSGSAARRNIAGSL